MTTLSPPLDTQKSCVIALLGAPNAGKSTLVNALVQTKISIVSPKVQTTRFNLRGIRCIDDTQLVFIDTPGIFEPKKRLDKAMVNAAWMGALEAQLVLLVVDASRTDHSHTHRIIAQLQEHNLPASLVLNKVDAIAKDALLPLTADFMARFAFEQVFMLSAKKRKGLEALEQFSCEKALEGGWLFPEDQLTDIHEKLFAAEITREKLFRNLHQELPYSLTVETEKWEQGNDDSAKCWQVIYVEKEGQKKIILGKGGEGIKRVGEQARTEISKLFGYPVHLFLHVKVRENWKDKPEHYQAMGLDFG